ncbi:MAG: right-handed parallel beta-helix repeat-containing protein [Caulobacterales bacterium]|nr:right-handed parallel beta-helix repeat-containing protein [Caulobacterales bacterium]
MISTVSTTAQLTAALATAHGGDTIQLASGSYSGLSISGLNIAGGVTITSADAAHEASIVGLKVSGSSGLAFRGLDFSALPSAGSNAFTVNGSHDIQFDQLHFHGSLDSNPGNDTAGLLIQSSSNVLVSNSTFEQLYWGLAHLNDSGLIVQGNTFHDLRMDGVRGGGSSYVTIENNNFSSFHPNTGDHADAIQFWTTGTTAAGHDIVIANNEIHRGTGAATQGIFMKDEVGNLAYQHVTISGNLVSGMQYNSIYVTHGADITATNNYVQGFTDMKSWIRLDYTTGGTVTGNEANVVTLSVGDSQIVQSGNTTIGLASDGGAAITASWQTTQTSASSYVAPSTTGLDLIGTSGADTLTGGNAGDTLSGGAGADLLTGGAGNDVYIFDGNAKVVEGAGGGHDTVQTTNFYTLSGNVEDLVLTGAHSTVGQGNALDNVITGNTGNNKLLGVDGADTLSGGDGTDTLVGGHGADQLTGGTGADVFSFTRGDGHDVIHDFGAGGAHDAIDVSAFYAQGLHATLTDGTSGVTISFTTGDSVLVENLHAADLHATTTGWVF